MSTEPSLPIDHRSRTLDGLRGICVLAVLYVHSLSHFTPMGSVAIGPFSFGTLFSNLGYAVTIFFGMSGYVLMLPYAKGRPFHTWTFYKKRAFRLLPLLWFASVASLLLYPIPPYFWQILWHLPFATYTYFLEFLLPSGITNIPGNPALWTLSVEIILSLLVPLFIFSFRTATAYAYASALAFVIALLLSWAEFLSSYRILEPFYIHAIAAAFLGLSVFLAGAYLALRPAWFMRHANLCLVLGIAGSLFILFSPVDSPSSLIPLAARSSRIFWWLFIKYEILKIVATACLIAGVLWSTWQLPKRLLSARVLRWPGIMCYSIYIWHMPLFGRLGAYFYTPTFWSAVLPVIFLWVMVFLAAIPSYFLFEKTATSLPYLSRAYAALRRRNTASQSLV